jgi:hypothetical protein
MLAVGLLLGWLLTRLIEQPAHRALMNFYDRQARRFWASRRPRASVVDSVTRGYVPVITVGYRLFRQCRWPTRSSSWSNGHKEKDSNNKSAHEADYCDNRELTNGAPNRLASTGDQ